MASASFSSFELLLLKSRHPPDTAALLLLAWVFVNKRVALEEDRRYLEVLAHGYRHTQDLDALLASAASRDLADIQLAAEVLLRERADEQSHPFLRRAIGLATSDGAPSLRNHHILRFLADLSGVAPDAFARLFREVTGQPLAAPADPSRHLYWQEHGTTQTPRTDAAAAAAEEGSPWRRWRAQRHSARAQRQQARQQREQLRQHARQRREEALRQARERQEEERRQARERQEEERRQARQRQEQARQQEQQRQDRERQQERREQDRQQQTGCAPPPHYRIRLALRVLELDEHASRRDIKQAYRRLAQRHHPDRFHGQGDLRIALASQRFQRIKNAYDYLMQHA